jgi:predicted MPP superfamily phosphohydrolase
VDGTVQQRGSDAALLKDLRARYGVYGVPGNHEYFSGYAEWMEFFRSINLQMLENTHRELPNGIYLAGITDRAARRRDLPMPDVEKSLQGIDKNAFTILLAHRPAYTDIASKLGADLQLSGHTHGGMIYGLDKIVARFNDYFAAGLYKIGDMNLYISCGTMIWNGFPFRLGTSPEITLITLKKSDIPAIE